MLPNLPIGPYLVEVTKDGFSKYVQTGIVLQVDTNPTVDVSLKVGAVSEQVTVEAGAAQVETRSTGIGQVVDNQRVSEMPLNGRDVHRTDLPGGHGELPGQRPRLNTVRNYPTVVVSVAGGAPDRCRYLLDGVIHQDPYNNLSLPLPFPDALQEFKVETSALPAQYGYHSTATVNAVTKSGTNEFHGDLFEFLRNGDLNARDFFRGQAARHAEAQPVRRSDRRTDSEGQAVLLRRLSENLAALGRRPEHRVCSHAGHGARRLHRDRFAGVQRRTTLCRRRSGFANNQISPDLAQPGGAEHREDISRDRTIRAAELLYGLVANQDEDLYRGEGRLSDQARSTPSSDASLPRI